LGGGGIMSEVFRMKGEPKLREKLSVINRGGRKQIVHKPGSRSVKRSDTTSWLDGSSRSRKGVQSAAGKRSGSADHQKAGESAHEQQRKKKRSSVASWVRKGEGYINFEDGKKRLYQRSLSILAAKDFPPRKHRRNESARTSDPDPKACHQLTVRGRKKAEPRSLSLKKKKRVDGPKAGVL